MTFVEFLDELYEYRNTKTKNVYDILFTNTVRPLYTTFKNHKIYSHEHMAKGAYIPVIITKKASMNRILSSLYLLYGKMDPAYIYSLLCLYMFNYIPFEDLIEDFATSEFPLTETTHMIEELQDRYINTGNKKYCYMISMIIRSNTPAYKDLEHKMCLYYNSTCPPNMLDYYKFTYESDNPILYKKVKIFNEIHPTYLEKKELLVIKAYRYISNSMTDMKYVYIAMLYKYGHHIDKLDINMDKLHDIIVDEDLNDFDKTIIYIIHWAKIITLAINKFKINESKYIN